MSQAGGNIGSVQVVFTGNTDPFKRAAAEVKSEASAAAKDVADAVPPENRVKEFRKGVGGVLGSVGAIAAVAAAVDKLLTGIQEFNAASGKMADSFRDIKDGLTFKIGREDGLAGQMQAIEEKHADTLRKIEADQREYYSGVAGLARRAVDETAGTFGAEFDLQRQQAAQALEGARRTFEELSKQEGINAANKRDADTRIKQGERLTDLQVDSINLERSLGTEQEQLNEQISERLRQIKDLRDERGNDPGFMMALDRAEKRLRDYLKRRNDMFAEAAQKDADSLERAMTKAIDSVRSKAATMFDPNQYESGLETIIQKIDIIASQLGRGT